MAAERGSNLGSMTARLLTLLDRVGSTELEAAIADAVARDVPNVGAIRQIIDHRQLERGLPPPVSVPALHNARAARVTVKNHSLSSYDQLNRTTDDDQEA